MSSYRGYLDELSKELLLYGNICYDLDTQDYCCNYIRLRVIEYKNKVYMHRMLNGELIELLEIWR